MSTTLPIHMVRVGVSPATLTRLTEEAARREMSVPVLARQALEAWLAEAWHATHIHRGATYGLKGGRV